MASNDIIINHKIILTGRIIFILFEKKNIMLFKFEIKNIRKDKLREE